MPRPRVFRYFGYLIAVLVIGWALSLAAVVAMGSWDRARPGEAIVVLGAAQYAGRPSPVLKARLDHAVLLWNQGVAPRVILTGGVGDGDTTSEAAVSRRYVMRRGVPDTAILMEVVGRTTNESLEGVVELMETGRVRSVAGPGREVILVSDRFHMLRLWILARRHDLVPYTSPTRTSPIGANPRVTWKYYLNESLKIPLILLLETRWPWSGT